MADKLPKNEVVFGASANWLFKEIRVTRMWDEQKRVLVYLVWSTQALSTGGSPYNSVSVVPVGAP
jgi:CreA protein